MLGDLHDVGLVLVGVVQAGLVPDGVVHQAD